LIQSRSGRDRVQPDREPLGERQRLAGLLREPGITLLLQFPGLSCHLGRLTRGDTGQALAINMVIMDDMRVNVLTVLLPFAAVAGLQTIVPGLDTALVLRTAITQGKRLAFATAFGINTGTFVWGAAAATGVSALLTASHMAYTALRITGAAYLTWYGATALWKTWQRRHEDPEMSRTIDQAAQDARSGVIRTWARGVTTNLLNPKAGVFYVAVLPQFIPPGAPHLPVGLLLALIHNIEGILWFTLLIHGTHLARTFLNSPAVKRAMDTITGTVLLGFGLKLALSDNIR
jgi:threonine/homoserine/homoserine lactone efflux protein